MGRTNWQAQSLSFAAILVLMGLNPSHSYDQWSNSFLLPGVLAIVIGPSSSPWKTLLGALPIDRRTWLKREMVRTTIFMTAMFVGLAVGVGLLQAGIEGWYPLVDKNAGTVLASFALTPWVAPAELSRVPDRPKDFLGRRFVVAVIVTVALTGFAVFLNVQWHHGQVPLVLALGSAVWAISFFGAWLAAKHILYSGAVS